MTFQNARSECPRCGEYATILDGTYDFRAEFLQTASQLTAHKLAQAEHAIKAAQKASRERIDLDAVIARLQEVNKDLADVVKKQVAAHPEAPAKTRQLWITEILALLAVLIPLLRRDGSIALSSENIEALIQAAINAINTPAVMVVPDLKAKLDP